MGYAFSDTPPVWREQMDGSSPAGLIAALDEAVRAAGWTAAAALSYGWVYELVSPQGLRCRVRIEDPNPGAASWEAKYASVQFESVDGARAARAFLLRCGAGIAYQAIVQQCQLWISRPGVGGSATPSAAAGGIPYVEGETPTELWWAAGSGSGMWWWYFQWPRVSHLVAAREPFTQRVVWSAAYNGTLTHSSEVAESAQLCILPLRGTWRGTPAARWANGRPLYHEALVAWGTAADAGGLRVRGQIWDAFCASVQRPLDEVVSADGGEWMNYTQSKYLALFLLRGGGAAVGNVAY